MVNVILARPADSPGYTHLVLADPVGDTQADVVVTATLGGQTQTLLIAGQREFDVLEGATVAFPDGSTWVASS